VGNRCVCVCVCVCEDGQASVMLSRTGKLHFSACKGMVGENTWAFYVVRPEGAYVQQGSAADMCTIIVWQVCVAGVCGRCMCSSERGSERSRYVCGRYVHQDCVAGVCAAVSVAVSAAGVCGGQACAPGLCSRRVCSSERGSERSRYVCGRCGQQDCVAGVCAAVSVAVSAACVCVAGVGSRKAQQESAAGMRTRIVWQVCVQQ